ncbi:2-oxo acid dehydrogenase subunit E2 [Streptomyces diacarni]|uniref:Acyltransferase n=1 Tax=Streptomyces diacarni TaxID=2800381 RepID=A0A367EDQ0_9ACTN|nr:2-oxo acid dehydrogenase subunit E2 [Streptomyces diacarni]RCG16191.1 acyltransferase [Streptomyces diacarni]
MRVEPFPRERRHTAHFLREIRGFSPVFLGADVDMSAVRRHQRAAREAGGNAPTVAYVLYVAARVLAAHPEANAAMRGLLRPRVTRYPTVAGKLALDKRLNGRRVVLAAVLPDLQRLSLEEIGQRIAHHREGDAEQLPEFAGVRSLQRLPVPLGRLVYRLATRPLHRRIATNGTFSVSSLGHRPVTSFHSVGGTTITLGLGGIADRPVVRDGAPAVAPVLPLSLTFDHRVLDGAEAADVLAEMKYALEAFADGDGEEDGGTDTAARQEAVGS